MKFNIGDVVRIKASMYDEMENVDRGDLVETNVTITDVHELLGMDGCYTYKIDRDTIWYPGSFFYLVDDGSDQYNNSNELDEFLAGFYNGGC